LPDSDQGRPLAPARRELNPRRGAGLLIGRLKDHGAANYQFRRDEDPSYYVRLLTSRGERTLWGKDLERAVKEGETQVKPGDLIGARRIGREAVTVTARQRDSEGRVIAQEEHHAHRTRWVVEKVTFFAERARLARRLRDEQVDVRQVVRERPELRSTFLSVRAAEEFAARRITNPEDRQRFLELVRGAIASSIQKGEPLPSVSLRNAQERKTISLPKPTRPRREDPTR
jgi:hypothetical protein